MSRQRLFDHMLDEHDLTLLEGEMMEIERIVLNECWPHHEQRFGERVSFRTVLERKKEQLIGREYSARWVPVGIPETHGILIGKRTLTNGITTYDADGYPTYKPDDILQVHLVVSDMQKNPVYTLIVWSEETGELFGYTT